MKPRIILAQGRGRIEGKIPASLFKAIRKQLSFFVSGAFFMPRYKSGKWDGRKHFFTLGTKSFPIGFVDEIVELFDEHGVAYDIVDNREALPDIDEATIEKGFKLKGIELRDYQKEAVRAAIEGKRGILELPTGSGKTAIATALINCLNVPTLFVVPSVELMRQTAKSFSERLPHIKDIGMIGGGERSIGFITVAIANSLVAFTKDETPKLYRKKKKRPIHKADCLKELEKIVKILVMDECHHIGVGMCNKIGNNSPIPYRYGLSATPLERTDGNTFDLIAVTGKVLYSIGISELIEAGVLARPFVTFMRISSPVRVELNYSTAYRECIVENEERNDLIVAKVLAKLPKKTLILVKHKRHGDFIKRAFERHGQQVSFLYSKMGMEPRVQCLADFDKGRSPVLISTPILNEGVDVPSIGVVAIAGGGKSKIALLQRIGRGMRIHGDDNTFEILDFGDVTNPYLAEHSLERLKQYYAEPAFVVTEEN